MVKEFFRRIFAEPIPQNREQEHMMALSHLQSTGSPGVESFSGYPSEDYLHEMRGKAKAKIFDKMVRSDAQVQMLLGAVKDPLLGASHEIQPVDDSAEEQEIAEFVRYVLMENSDKPWHEFVNDALTSFEHGFSAIEKTYKLVFDDPKFGIFYGIKGLDLIGQKTVERFNIDRDGKLLSLTQIAYGDTDRYVEIPAPYLMVFSQKKTGANHEGISWLRPIYGNWLRKQEYHKINAIGIERSAIATPDVEIPPGFQNGEDYPFLVEALNNYASGDNNYFIRFSNTKINWNPTSYDPTKIEASIDAEDRRMAKSFKANFLELGMQGGGAFALSNDLSDFLLAGLVGAARVIEGPVNRQLIPELVMMKYGKRAKYPEYKMVGIDDKAGKELAEILGIMIDKSVIVPDDELEVSMRKRFGFSKKSEKGQRKIASAAPAEEEKNVSLSERIRRRWNG